MIESTQSNKWDIDIYKAVDIKEKPLKFIFDQAEKSLNDSISIRSSLILRLNTIVTICSTIALGLVVWIWTNIFSDTCDMATFFSALAILMQLTATLFIVINLIIGHKYSSIGNYPQNMINDVDTSLDEDTSYKFALLQQLNIYQSWISENDKRNSKGWKYYKYIIYSLAGLPITGAIVFLLINFLSFLCQAAK